LDYDIKHMKWWGWGDPNKQFDITDKPKLKSYIEKKLGVRLEPINGPTSLDSIELPPTKNDPQFLTEIQSLLDENQIKIDKQERLIHAYGKSFRDLWRIRKGIIDNAPDMVIYPKNEDQVRAVILAANKYNICVIPFGGGSNIAGCVESKDLQHRMCVSLDMKWMNRVLDIDEHSGVARIQAGVLGPSLEQQLNQAGYTLGHLPDSFEYSTLGGWVATRSAGMQSDRYGKIEDMVLALRMVTPTGTIETKPVPKCSNGINPNHICIGSEGILGVITEVTVVVHPLPPIKDYYAYFFPDFEKGIKAIYECVRENCLPDVTRLNDADKTALSLAYKGRSSFSQMLLTKLMSLYLRKVKKLDFNNACIMIVSFSSLRAKTFKAHKKKVNAIFRKHQGICLGTSPGRAFERGKYDFPYLRDYVMDCNIMVDVSETATVWSNLLPLYQAVKNNISQAILATGVQPWVGCHVSHNYYTGASLYFTFACQQKKDEELNQYLQVKKAAEDTFMQYGGTLSHHHAIGYEHLPWISEDISAVGVSAVKALKQGVDPNSIMNPGKIIPSSTEPLIDWGLTQCFVEKPVSSQAPHQD
jgi:alkyldihydroxyacetonephosphate synthase